MSPDIVPVLFTPDTGTVNKLVTSVLIPTYRTTIGSQYQQGCLRCLIEDFTFIQLLYPLLTDISAIWRTFCLLTHAVHYQPLEREAPQGGLETLPVKRIRETNHQFRDYMVVYVSLLSLPNNKETARFFLPYNINRCLSSHLKLWWINFKELSSWFTERLLYLKVPWFIAGHTHERTTSCKNKAGRGICMTSKSKNINQLRSDKFVGNTPAQFLHEDR
jgi:hypothetical protein